MKLSGKRDGASPGGPALSVAKRRRLAALDDARMGAGPTKTATTGAISTAPLSSGMQKPRPGGIPVSPSGVTELPYNRLESAVLDGSLSAALADAKAAANAVEEIGYTAGSSVSTDGVSSPTFRAARLALSAVPPAAAAAAGNDSMAAEMLGKLISTNPRASGSDLRSILSQRLQDRTVMLENPIAPVKVHKLFARRGTRYSVKLCGRLQRKHRGTESEQKVEVTPSYEAMLRVHELWIRYADGLARSAVSRGAAESSATGHGTAKAHHVVDLHGAMISVVKHTNPQLVGATGVVLRHNDKNIQLITPGDRLRVVPLKGCLAHYTVNGTTMQLSG